MLPLKFLTSPKLRGFTLIEVLIVIAILGAMAGIVVSLVNPIGQRNKGNDAKRKADLRQIQSALEFYRTDAGVYPATVTCNGTITYNTTTYMSKVPCPPGGTPANYYYTVGASPVNAYCLRACLQTSTDPERDAANPKYGNNEAPTPAQMGSTCASFGSSCPANTVSYTVLNP